MNDETPPASHLFTLRVWPEKEEGGEIRWRGKLHHVPSGEIRYFRGWASLLPLLLDLLRRNNQSPESGTRVNDEEV